MWLSLPPNASFTYHFNMREKILEEIKRLAKANGGISPGGKTFENATGIRRHDWLGKYWSKWSDAVTEAGLKPLEKSKKIERSFIFSKLAEIVKHYKREPTRAEIEMYRQVDSSLPWYPTLLEHFGSKIEMVAALRDWAKVSDGYDDIVAMLPENQTFEKNTSSTITEGYVYLIKSGAFYKIGRGDELEKRVKQIRTALPDSSTLEHSIRTDDPPGIEAYWHRRFAEKRANGEWFKLSTIDVVAFRKRKYQ
jgi:hypothetical protein